MIHYQDDAVTLYHGDCLDILRGLPDASVHAVVTDPPYALEFMGRGWDKFTPLEFEAWCAAWAAECLRVLKPGGHLLAFGGTRTWHRLAAGIEDAGFEIRDSIAWVYAQGFPKSLDVSKAIDARGGNSHLAELIGAAIKAAREARGWTTGQADRHFCGGSTNWTWYEGRKAGARPPTPDDFGRIASEWPELAPLAALVDKAEREVIGRTAHRSGIGNATAGHYTVGGTKAEHVDITAPATPDATRWQGWGTALKPAHEPIVVARKPLSGTVAATVLAHGTGAINVDGCRVGTGVATGLQRPERRGKGDTGGWANYAQEPGVYGTPDGAGRWPPNVLLDPTTAAELDRQSGETVSESRPRASGTNANPMSWGEPNRNRPRLGHTDSGGASRMFPVFRYEPKASTAERPRVQRADGTWESHATVKPLDLMRWLVRLVTPPGGTVLEPFSGSGTTAEACVIEGFQCIAIEREADYLPLNVQRLTKPIETVLDLGGIA